MNRLLLANVCVYTMNRIFLDFSPKVVSSDLWKYYFVHNLVLKYRALQQTFMSVSVEIKKIWTLVILVSCSHCHQLQFLSLHKQLSGAENRLSSWMWTFVILVRRVAVSLYCFITFGAHCWEWGNTRQSRPLGSSKTVWLVLIVSLWMYTTFYLNGKTS